MGHGADALRRSARRRKRIPAGVACAKCGVSLPVLVSRRAATWLCYEHQLVARGLAAYEGHHVLPRAQDPRAVARTPANAHRMLEEMKRGWPDEVLRNRTNDPLLRLAGEARSRADWARIMERQNRRGAAWLELLQERLDAHLGSDYLSMLDMPPLSDYLDDDETR